MKRLRISIRGAVQGVGFRPFVYRLARDLHLAGWVNNSPQGVFIEIEGDQISLDNFLLRLPRERPPRSFIQSLESSWLDPVGYSSFEIRPSESSGQLSALVLPDIATCPECLGDISSPGDRRYQYPFTNCTNCGPRFTIIEALPYDRQNTSMKAFTMCPQCQAEYDDPANRRFHAQPNACPQCGPHLELWDPAGKVLAERQDALAQTVQRLQAGAIVAVKGLGGFHLLVAAPNDDAVLRLRARKHREEKPFALMFPSLESIKANCQVNPSEGRLLCSPESPIVILQRHSTGQLSPSVAPGNPNLGVMLPSNPLHHLLMAALGSPVVATSGNLSDEPICIDEHDALKRLSGIADFFLVHNRPIVRHVDDSIVRVMLAREMVLRRARGYAPLPIQLQSPVPPTIAVGAHLKNSVALAFDRHVFISQHIGDLETAEAYDAFQRVLRDLQNLYQSTPSKIVADLHPDYLSTKYAHETGLPLVQVQHHYAHVLSCMAENDLQPPVFGISWDGTGYGLDSTVWGGEFVVVTQNQIKRVGHFRTFCLPGGEVAVREPRRVALGLLYEIFGDSLFSQFRFHPLQAFSSGELAGLKTMLQRSLNAPRTSSVGRLFDAVASIAGLRQQLRFEGQAAMELEFATADASVQAAYPFDIVPPSAPDAPFMADWEPMIRQIITDTAASMPAPEIASKFHSTLAAIIVAAARIPRLPKVCLSGGCFQNKCLTERAVHQLSSAGFQPYWHQRVPPNDGGIALGQIVAASRANR